MRGAGRAGYGRRSGLLPRLEHRGVRQTGTLASAAAGNGPLATAGIR